MADAKLVSTVHFNALPADVRARFADATHRKGPVTPVISDVPGAWKTTVWPVVIGIASLLALNWLWHDDYGRLWGSNAVYGVGGLLAMGTAIFGALAVVAYTVRRLAIGKRLPFAPGVYIIGPNLIDARTAVLRVTPVMQLSPDIVHHHTNGSYTHTAVSFRGPGGHAFVIRNRRAAEFALQELRDMLGRFFAAVEQQDFATIAGLDLFLTAGDPATWNAGGKDGVPAPSDGPGARAVPWAMQHALIVALAASAAIAPGVWFLRNRGSDDAMFADAKSSTSSLREYLRQGGRHTDEAGALLFVRGLAEAKAEHSVTALRAFFEEYPNAPEAIKADARAAVHEHFAEALTKFKATAPVGDDQTVRFVEDLMAFQEAHDSPALLVSFLPPLVDSLQEIDDLLAATAKEEKSKLDVAPIAPHFADNTSSSRERTIVDGLREGFSAVFANDIVALEQGARRTADVPPPTDKASIDVSYTVEPMREDDGEPVIYQEVDEDPLAGIGGLKKTPTGRLYIGVAVHFSILMRVPGVAKAHSIQLSVKPPEHFSVPAGGYGFETEASDASIYSIMAERAFDELRTKLHGAFFGLAPRDLGDAAFEDEGEDPDADE